MGRGGGGHHSSHHSHRSHHRSSSHHYHSSGGGSYAPSDPEDDAQAMCVSCGFMFIFFLALCLGSGFGAMAASGTSCSDISSLNRNEQAFCKPRDLDLGWVAQVYGKGRDYAKVYRAAKSSLARTNRTYTWLNYKEKLFYSYSYFTVASPLGVTVDLTITTNEPDELKVFFLTSHQFYYATRNDDFSERYYPEEQLTVNGNGKLTWHGTSGANNTMMYLVFSSMWHSVSYTYDITLNYELYDVSLLKEVECSGKCEFTDMKKDEIIILDYNSSTTSVDCSKKHGPEPDYFDIWLHDNAIDWVAAGCCFGIFGFLAVLALFFCTIFFAQCMIYKARDSKSVSMNTVVVADNSKVEQPAATPDGTPSAAIQPTPGAVAASATPPAYPVDQAQPYPSEASAPISAYSDPNMNTEYPADGIYPSTNPYPTDPSATAPV